MPQGAASTSRLLRTDRVHLYLYLLNDLFFPLLFFPSFSFPLRVLPFRLGSNNPNMASAKVALLLYAWCSLARVAVGHVVLTYPGWRGNNLILNDTFPFGMQWMYPCTSALAPLCVLPVYCILPVIVPWIVDSS